MAVTIIPVVYALVDPITNEIRNIGQSINKRQRYYAHTSPVSYNKGNTYTRRWIRSLAKRKLKPRMVVIETVSIDCLDEAEIFWIEEFRRIGCKLTNTIGGGKGIRGFKHSEETKDKMRKAAKGRLGINKGIPRSEVVREKISGALKGHKLSEETKRKISQTKIGCPGINKGKKFSEKVKKKMSEGSKGVTVGEKHPNAKLIDNDIKTILSLAQKKIYPQITLAKMYNVDPSVICKIIKRKAWTHVDIGGNLL